eukprot:TRINITY_DN47624_c0_g1_i1.p1 TRINITY_DN47624_c0_g1~~TRINITY_DN47624_c0_g1_i1.p1  ORF type:complete len:216 (-),score=6.00 TRINITY_DN47624_c0_g1_i1:131-739(-)
MSSRCTVESMVRKLNSHDNCIVVTHEGDQNGRKVNFLDVSLSCERRIDRLNFTYETFRKPLCMYDYTPGNSAHAPSVMLSIVKGALHRLLRTCSTKEAYHRQVRFFFSKLKLRGHDLFRANTVFEQMSWNRRSVILEAGGRTNTPTIAFKIPWSNDVPALRINGACADNRRRLDGLLDEDVRMVVCYTARKNLFRLRYAHYF